MATIWLIVKIYLWGIIFLIPIYVLTNMLYSLLYDLRWYVYGIGSKEIPNSVLNELQEIEEGGMINNPKFIGVYIDKDKDKKPYEFSFHFEGTPEDGPRYHRSGGHAFIPARSLRRELQLMQPTCRLEALITVGYILSILSIWPYAAYGLCVKSVNLLTRSFASNAAKIQPENIDATVDSCTAHHHFFFKNKFCVCDLINVTVTLEKRFFGLSYPYSYHKIRHWKGFVLDRDITITSTPEAGKGGSNVL